MRMIACVLSNEMFHMLKGQETFDQARYVAGLNALPEIPWSTKEYLCGGRPCAARLNGDPVLFSEGTFITTEVCAPVA